jgi:hypothetical protein
MKLGSTAILNQNPIFEIDSNQNRISKTVQFFLQCKHPFKFNNTLILLRLLKTAKKPSTFVANLFFLPPGLPLSPAQHN